MHTRLEAEAGAGAQEDPRREGTGLGVVTEPPPLHHQQGPGSGSPSGVRGGPGTWALCPQPAHRAEAGFRSPSGPRREARRPLPAATVVTRPAGPAHRSLSKRTLWWILFPAEKFRAVSVSFGSWHSRSLNIAPLAFRVEKQPQPRSGLAVPSSLRPLLHWLARSLSGRPGAVITW